jgi:hypothetical protein
VGAQHPHMRIEYGWIKNWAAPWHFSMVDIQHVIKFAVPLVWILDTSPHTEVVRRWMGCKGLGSAGKRPIISRPISARLKFVESPTIGAEISIDFSYFTSSNIFINAETNQEWLIDRPKNLRPSPCLGLAGTRPGNAVAGLLRCRSWLWEAYGNEPPLRKVKQRDFAKV